MPGIQPKKMLNLNIPEILKKHTYEADPATQLTWKEIGDHEKEKKQEKGQQTAPNQL